MGIRALANEKSELIWHNSATAQALLANEFYTQTHWTSVSSSFLLVIGS